MKEEYPIEFIEILHYLRIGTELNSPVLFDRKLDELVLANIESFEKEKTSINVDSYYKLTLPFVDGIPPERLLDLRTNMPNAFLDFRNSMFEIIFDLQKNGFQKEIFELKIHQRVNPLLSKLDTEMKNSLLKAKVLGIGVPIVSGLGAWGLWQVGVDASKIASLILGGAGIPAEMKVITDRLVDRNTSKLNPFYYLWKAKRK